MAIQAHAPGLSTMRSFQASSSRWQATPIIGPALVSPIKIAISTIEIITGVLMSLFFAGVAGMCLLTGSGPLHREFTRRSEGSMRHFNVGLSGVFYGAMNIATIGLVGCIGECQRHRRSFTN